MRSAKGSVDKLGPNRWRVRVTSKLINPETGKRERITEVVRGSRREAEEVKLRMLTEAGEDVADSSMTLGDYVAGCYVPAKEAQIREGRFKRSTLESYKDRLRIHVLPWLGDVELRELTPQLIRAWLERFEKPTVAKEALKTLSSVLSTAVYDFKLRENPCKRVKPPKTVRYQPKPLDLEDMEVYRYFFRGTTVEAAVLLAMGGGFRRGEICALDVEDVNLTTGEVTIDDAYITVRGEALEETPKSESGTRSVYLPMSIVRRLAEIMPHDGPLLPGRDGRMYPDAVSRQYRRIQAAMPPEVPRIPFKDLRHSSLTLAYESGADALSLKDRGGHSNIDTTRRYYVRPKGNRDIEIARAMDEMLEPSEAPRHTVKFDVYEDSIEAF